MTVSGRGGTCGGRWNRSGPHDCRNIAAALVEA